MKKLLALVLALVMTLSLATVGTNAFTDDAQVKDDYAEAVQVLTGMNVFKGYTDNSFKPLNDITRAEVAAIVYRIYTGDVTDAKASVYAGYGKFDDVNVASWYAGYVGYCTNAGFIKGYGDGKFGPNDKVTGYQALAMILRAVGYGKNGEFEGKDWELHVAQVAQQIGALKNVAGEVLKNPASRQLVAELLFQCLQTPQVVYTPAFGYAPVSIIAGQKSLGEKVFNLKYNYKDDVWGRPAKVWTYTTGNKKTTLPETPVASYTVKVDECDISKDLGINSSVSLEKAFIDGEEYKTTNTAVTSNGVGSINPRATTSYVGAQGRLTEVYDMGDGLRIVEINTYLANVTKVTAEKTDKNGHKTAATVDLAVWMTGKGTTAFKAVEAEGFTKGEYVLVTISNPSNTKLAAIESIEAAPIVAGGSLSGWTNAAGLKAATHIFGKNSFNDADKFFLNYRTSGSWAVLTDKYGNAIGLAQVANNYLVVEKIEWQHNAGSFGGYALADVVLADGTAQKNVTVAYIGNNPANNHGDKAGVWANGSVSDNYWNNSVYYKHILTYSVNDNGSYNIAIAHDNTNNPADETKATIVKGQATISTATNTYVATDKTVFLLADDPGEIGTSYTAYVGKKNVKSIEDATLCILTDSNGYAVLVVASDYADEGSSFVAFVTDGKAELYNRSLGDGHFVYKMGETTPTTVWTGAGKFNYENTGLYSFKLDSYGIITEMKYLLQDLTKDGNVSINSPKVDRVAIKADELGTSFQAYGYSDLKEDKTAEDFGYSFKAGAAIKDYNVTDDTKVILVTKTAMDGTAVLEEGSMADVKADSIAFVKYTAVGRIYNADVIYVFVNTGFTPVVVDEYKLVIDDATMDSDKGPEIIVSLTKNGQDHYKISQVNSCTVKVYNADTGKEVRSTNVQVQNNSENNTLVITADTQLTQGDNYYAVVTLNVGKKQITAVLTTPELEAQPAAATGK